MKTRLIAAAVAGLVIAATTQVATAPAGAAPPSVVTQGAAWLGTQQKADGGYEVSGFPGFETPDAVLAVAEAGQTGSTWSTSEALAAVQAQANAGKDGLDALDDLADGAITPAQAAKLVVLDIAPLGLSATDFDPSSDSASAVDLQATILAAAGTGDYSSVAAFNGRLYIALALEVLGQPVPAALTASIEGGQQANGFWSYTGLPTGSDLDVDTTALAIQALVAAGRTSADAGVAKALAALAGAQQADGAWQAFGADDPNSTAVAMLAVRAAGGSTASSCWRDAATPANAATPYVDPTTWLTAQAAPDHHIASPNDTFGVNTFATSQGLEALGGLWLPVARAANIECPAATADATFIRSAYTDVLQRPADPGGATYLLGKLLAGSSRTVVPSTLTASREYRRRQVDAIYTALLGRSATPSEHASDDPLLARRRIDIYVKLFGSPAYLGTPSTGDDAWLTKLYTTALRRTPDAAGRTLWLAALAAGRPRTAVARSVLVSGEARGLLVDALYGALLHRAPDAAGREFWKARLVRGATFESIIVPLVGSSEYFALANAT